MTADAQLRDELVTFSYRPMLLRRQEIPKDGGKKVRVLSIPAIRDRVVQGAVKLILEPIFEADFQPGSFGYRPKRTAHGAVKLVSMAIVQHKTRVIDLDLRAYFDSVRHDLLLAKVAVRVNDDDVLHLLKMMLKTTGTKGVPQGGVISPLLSNVYLNETDRMLEQARAATREGEYTALEYARFADDLVVLVDGRARHDWVLTAVQKRLRDELATLQVEVNEEKTRTVALKRGERFGFLGFDVRRVRSLKGRWRAQCTPMLKQRTALLRALKGRIPPRAVSTGQGGHPTHQPEDSGMCELLCGGAIGTVLLVHQKLGGEEVHRHLMRNAKRQGFGWRQWRREWINRTLGLFADYRVRLLPAVAGGRRVT